MLKISCACCLGWFPAISTQFTLKMCVTARNHRKFTKCLYFKGSRSYIIIDVDSFKKLITSAYDKQHVCAFLQLFLC